MEELTLQQQLIYLTMKRLMALSLGIALAVEAHLCQNIKRVGKKRTREQL